MHLTADPPSLVKSCPVPTLPRGTPPNAKQESQIQATHCSGRTTSTWHRCHLYRNTMPEQLTGKIFRHPAPHQPVVITPPATPPRRPAAPPPVPRWHCSHGGKHPAPRAASRSAQLRVPVPPNSVRSPSFGLHAIVDALATSGVRLHLTRDNVSFLAAGGSVSAMNVAQFWT